MGRWVIVHALPHRVRLRSAALRDDPEACRRIAVALGQDPRHARITARPATGSLLVEAREDGLDARALAERVARLADTVTASVEGGGDSPVSPRPPGPTRIARAVVHAIAEINDDVRTWFDGRADLGSILPVIFAGGGLVEVLLTRRLPVPSWHDLLWWSLRSFALFNTAAIEQEVRPVGRAPDEA